MSTIVHTRCVSRLVFPVLVLLGLTCGVGLAPSPALAGASATDDLREIVARDGWVSVRVELAAEPSVQGAAAAGVSAAAAAAREDAVENLLFGLPEGSYADVERLAEEAALVMRVDAAGLDGLSASSEVAGIAPTGMPAAMRRLTAGFYHSLALKPDGSLWAWGDNGAGQLGDGTRTDRLRPVAVLSGMAAVAGGDFHTLA